MDYDHEVQFTDKFPALPSDAPAGHPRIVDIASYTPMSFEEGGEVTNMKLQDATVTMLHSIFSDASGVLARFLDVTAPPFMLIQTQVEPSGAATGNAKLAIGRKGNNVLVGLFFEYPDHDVYGFDNLVRYTVNDDGSWSINHMSFGEYFPRDWQRVWAKHLFRPDDPRACESIVVNPDNDPNNFGEKLQQQTMAWMMDGELWKAEMSKWTIV